MQSLGQIAHCSIKPHTVHFYPTETTTGKTSTHVLKGKHLLSIYAIQMLVRSIISKPLSGLEYFSTHILKDNSWPIVQYKMPAFLCQDNQPHLKATFYDQAILPLQKDTVLSTEHRACSQYKYLAICISLAQEQDWLISVILHEKPWDKFWHNS